MPGCIKSAPTASCSAAASNAAICPGHAQGSAGEGATRWAGACVRRWEVGSATPSPGELVGLERLAQFTGPLRRRGSGAPGSVLPDRRRAPRHRRRVARRRRALDSADARQVRHCTRSIGFSGVRSEVDQPRPLALSRSAQSGGVDALAQVLIVWNCDDRRLQRPARFARASRAIISVKLWFQWPRLVAHGARFDSHTEVLADSQAPARGFSANRRSTERIGIVHVGGALFTDQHRLD